MNTGIYEHGRDRDHEEHDGHDKVAEYRPVFFHIPEMLLKNGFFICGVLSEVDLERAPGGLVSARGAMA